MAASFSESTALSILYRMARWFVICGVLAVSFSQIVMAQSASGSKVTKGPRALGLLELAPDGKAHLIPITILIDGRYFDAGAYKAAPVPMALWGDTVYEAIGTGVSRGLFTVTGALQRNNTKEWIGEGRWQSAASLAAISSKAPQKASVEPRGLNEDVGPPVLRRGGAQKPKPEEPPAPAGAGQSAPTSTPAAPPLATPAIGAPASSAPGGNSSGGSATGSSSSSGGPPADNPPEDKDRPVLKRGKPAPAPKEELETPAAVAKGTGHGPAASATKTSSNAAGAPSSAASSAAANAVQLIPAISDSGGPEPRPYAYSMTPDEESGFRKKMLALAADEVRARAAQLAGDASDVAVSSRAKSRAAKAQTPSFDNVQLRVFDLANSNEPELVLTATAQMPPRSTAKDNGSPDLQYLVTFVAREDVNGEFHKALANVTDTQHLDVLPRLELIDVVDVDGDGRGELLFRQVSDAGSGFVVYRVIGDRLYPLFQGASGT